VNTTFETVVLKVTEPTASSKYLRLYNVSTALEGAGYLFSLFRFVRYISKWDRNLVRMQKGAGLILMELHPSQGQGVAVDQCPVK